MRKRFAVVPIAAAIAIFSAPAGASAATQIGNVCTGTQSGGPNTWAELANKSSGLPLAVPSAGVLTSWRVDSGFSVNLPEQLKILRVSGKSNELRVVEEETPQTVTEGENVFAARIPVQAGDLLGLYSKLGVPFCVSTNSGDVAGVYSGNGGDLLTTDAAAPFPEDPKIRIPVSAFIEPDVDGDGFGDETQDKCPQSAQFQTECPQISMEQFAVPGKGAVTDAVVADHEAPVTVTAKAKGISLQGGTQTVVPGKLSKFKLKFSKPLKKALASLPKGKSLKLTITAAAKNLSGQPFSSTTTLKLKG